MSLRLPFVQAAEDAGADALAIMNSYPAMATDILRRVSRH